MSKLVITIRLFLSTEHGYGLPSVGTPSSARICWSQQDRSQDGAATTLPTPHRERLLYPHSDQNQGIIQVSLSYSDRFLCCFKVNCVRGKLFVVDFFILSQFVKWLRSTK